MNEIPLKYREAVNTYEPVEFEGMTLYPILVREYEAFGNARPALDFLQQSLPVRFLSMPLLSAYFAMDAENRKEGKPSDGLFLRALLFLVLSLRYREDLGSAEERVRDFARGVYVQAENHGVLKEIRFEQDGAEHAVTPVLFQRMRPVLAAQNGIELASGDANPELVEDERYLAELNGPELDPDPQALISFAAAMSKAEEREVYDWPILKLNRRAEAFERTLQYLVCGISAASGAQFKGGNPVPSPIFARRKRESGALIDMDAFTRGQRVSVSETAPAGPAEIKKTT